MADHLQAELADLSASLRAHLEVEEELGSGGLAAWQGAEGQTSIARTEEQVRRPEPSTSDLPKPPREQGQAALGAPEKLQQLQQLAVEAAACTACVLHEKRKRSVFARGSPDAELVFVGEGPGHDEDIQGLPFVGAAGQLLDRMIEAMGFGRDEVYVCNIVKCRPPDNRTPRPEEAIACARFLVPQLELIAPKIIVALGRCAAENLGVAPPGAAWRGRWGAWHGFVVMPTYHPAYLLRSPEHKRVVWQDLQQVMGRLGRTGKARPGPGA